MSAAASRMQLERPSPDPLAPRVCRASQRVAAGSFAAAPDWESQTSTCRARERLSSSAAATKAAAWSLKV